MFPRNLLFYDPCQLPHSGDDWVIVICEPEYTLGETAVYMNGVDMPLYLSVALNIFGKGHALRGFKRQGKKPLVALVSSWSALAQYLGKRFTIVLETHGNDENSYALDCLYTVTNDGHAIFYHRHKGAQQLKLASY